jgi:hypothetical protein
MSDYKTDHTPYLLQTQTDARGQKIGDCIVPLASLRDQFAMAALSGIEFNYEMWGEPKERAERAYALADAMMEARK